MKKYRLPGVIIGALLLILGVTSGHAQDFSQVQIKTIKVKPGIHMLLGQGGNIGVFSGEDGVFMIDDQYAPLTDKIKTAIAGITPDPIRFLINTHWHMDHTGGNENIGNAVTIIIAHENVRERLSSDQVLSAMNRTVPALSKKGLPIITFTRDIAFHLNGQRLSVFHVERSHTDGDVVIHFNDANVIHMGDVHFAGMYPFIDIEHGGSITGMIAAVNRILELADDNTRIIPGHGQLTNKKGLIAYRDMLTGISNIIQAKIKAGKTLAHIIETKPTGNFDKEWGKGFIAPDMFATIVYQSLTQK
jgi:cyclase